MGFEGLTVRNCGDASHFASTYPFAIIFDRLVPLLIQPFYVSKLVTFGVI